MVLLRKLTKTSETVCFEEEVFYRVTITFAFADKLYTYVREGFPFVIYHVDTCYTADMTEGS